MELVMTPGFKEAIVPLLTSCGGAGGPMHNIAGRIDRSNANDLREILGRLVDAPGPIREIIDTCEQTNGQLDLEGLIRHFASYQHTAKMTNLPVTVARELPAEQIPVAHTLLPLTVEDGKFYYVCGDARVELVGLIHTGSEGGSPYAHLASLLWLKDDGLHSEILAKQSTDGVVTAAKGLKTISYFGASRLRNDTIAGARELRR